MRYNCCNTTPYDASDIPCNGEPFFLVVCRFFAVPHNLPNMRYPAFPLTNFGATLTKKIVCYCFYMFQRYLLNFYNPGQNILEFECIFLLLYFLAAQPNTPSPKTMLLLFSSCSNVSSGVCNDFFYYIPCFFYITFVFGIVITICFWSIFSCSKQAL